MEQNKKRIKIVWIIVFILLIVGVVMAEQDHNNDRGNFKENIIIKIT